MINLHFQFYKKYHLSAVNRLASKIQFSRTVEKIITDMLEYVSGQSIFSSQIQFFLTLMIKSFYEINKFVFETRNKFVF